MVYQRGAIVAMSILRDDGIEHDTKSDVVNQPIGHVPPPQPLRLGLPKYRLQLSLLYPRLLHFVLSTASALCPLLEEAAEFPQQAAFTFDAQSFELLPARLFRSEAGGGDRGDRGRALLDGEGVRCFASRERLRGAVQVEVCLAEVGECFD